jgi:hypothetical protein
MNRWLSVAAAARLAEGFPSAELLALWRASVLIGAGVDGRTQLGEESR